MSDDIDDEFFDKIKKLFKINADVFDLDFFMFPESNNDKDPNLNFDVEDVKGFEVSYHYETGMDKPEIKIRGNIDKEKIQDFFKKYKFNFNPNNMQLRNPNKTGAINANELSLELFKESNDSQVVNPRVEINDRDDYSEIVIEVPGIEKKDVIVSFSGDRDKLTFSAENNGRKYFTSVYLPFKSSIDNYGLEVNNGIAILIIKDKNKL